MLITVRNARTMLDCGYTSAFSAASAKPRLDVVLKRAIEAGRVTGPAPQGGRPRRYEGPRAISAISTPRGGGPVPHAECAIHGDLQFAPVRFAGRAGWRRARASTFSR